MTENKLDFLMRLTGTRNSVLSKAISFDPSYISRIKSGRRPMPDTPQFVNAAAAYFSRNIRTKAQEESLAAVLCPGQELPENRDVLSSMLCAWLTEQPIPQETKVGQFLSGFSRASRLAADPAALSPPAAESAALSESIRLRTEQLEQEASRGWYFYGNAGKRRAVEIFLGRLINTGKAYQLLLFSDEEMSWLYEDPEFAKRWAVLLRRLLEAGSRIRIPHNITRDSNEMFEAVQNWIPLYMTGAIEAYYYPRLRDGIYHRSLFVASGDSALISSSVGSQHEGMLNILVDDKTAVRALEREFSNYLELCRPLMHIFNGKTGREFFPSALRFERQSGDLMMAHSIPAIFTMPPAEIRLIQARCEDTAISDFHTRSYAAFREHMRNRDSVTEILSLPDPDDVKNGRVLLPVSDFLKGGPLYVTTEELQLHLGNVIRLLKREPNYRVVLSAHFPSNVILHVRERSGAQLISASAPSTAFEITELNMTTAFWEYLLQMTEQARVKEKEEVIRQLEAYVRSL